jgi:hypothetical protein
MVDMRCVPERITKPEFWDDWIGERRQRDTLASNPFSVIWAFASFKGDYPRTLAGPMRVGTPIIK